MTFLVETGKRYRATIRLGWVEGIASNESIAARLQDAGFVDVEVWQPGDSARDRMARGEWGGASQTVELPEQVTHVEVIS